MKQCWNIRSELSAYVDAELPATRRAEVAAHVAGCADCREHLAELQQLANGVAALPRAAVPSGVLVEVRRRLQQAPVPAVRWWSPAWGTAVAALIVAGMVAFWWNGRRPATLTTVAKVKSAPASVDRMHRVQIAPEEKAAEAKSADKVTEPRKWEMADSRAAGDAVRLEMPSAASLPATAPAPSAKPTTLNKEVAPTAEVLTVVGEDVRAVQEEARMIVASLQGQVATAAGQSGARPSFKVLLPAGNVTAFKARFALREAGRKDEGLARHRGAEALQENTVAAPVVKMGVPRMPSGLATGGAAKDRPVDLTLTGRYDPADVKHDAAPVVGGEGLVQTQGWAVIEIRVLPAGQR
jgi:hypothetical protein